MVSINYAFREISCKIVYYGPGLSGKTTNLQCVHDRLPTDSRGDLISLATEADRTLYFDFLPLNVGDIGGFATKFQMYTVPGQVFYNATRRLVLRGVDGIVFVADSQRAKMDENIESLADMHDNLRSYGIDPVQIPIIMQYNKRDLPDVASIEELEEKLNPDGRPYVEASAVNGVGVFDTVKRISKLVLENIRRQTVRETAPTAAAARKRPVTASGPAAARSDNTAAAPGRQPKPAVGRAASPACAPPRRVPAPVRQSVHRQPPRPAGATIIAAQKSTRVRRRKRSLLDRLFGWLIGR